MRTLRVISSCSLLVTVVFWLGKGWSEVEDLVKGAFFIMVFATVIGSGRKSL